MFCMNKEMLHIVDSMAVAGDEFAAIPQETSMEGPKKLLDEKGTVFLFASETGKKFLGRKKYKFHEVIVDGDAKVLQTDLKVPGLNYYRNEEGALSAAEVKIRNQNEVIKSKAELRSYNLREKAKRKGTVKRSLMKFLHGAGRGYDPLEHLPKKI